LPLPLLLLLLPLPGLSVATGVGDGDDLLFGLYVGEEVTVGVGDVFGSLGACVDFGFPLGIAAPKLPKLRKTIPPTIIAIRKTVKVNLFIATTTNIAYGLTV